MTPDIRKAYADHLEHQAQWQCALTLSYHESSVSIARIRQDLKSLRNKIDRILLGSRYYKRQPHERSQFWAVIEKRRLASGQSIETDPHVHCGWKMPEPHGIEDLRRTLAGGIWLTFARRGSYDAAEYKSGWSGYATKTLIDSMDIIESAEILR